MTKKPRKQESLPGIGDPEIEEQARRVRDITSERIALQETENEEREKLLEMMDGRGYDSFRFEEDGTRFVSRIKVTRTVSVRNEENLDDASDAGDGKAKSPRIEGSILDIARAAQADG